MAAPEIEHSTKEERKKFIEDTYQCRGNCDGCGICQMFHGRKPVIAYEDYIEGQCSYQKVSERFW